MCGFLNQSLTISAFVDYQTIKVNSDEQVRVLIQRFFEYNIYYKHCDATSFYFSYTALTRIKLFNLYVSEVFNRDF